MRERLLDLIEDLRGAGLAISVAETVDALRAVELAGIERTVLREALAAALVKYEDDRAAFDAAFDATFAAPEPAASGRKQKHGRGSPAGGAGGRTSGSTPSGSASGRGSTSSAEPPRDDRRMPSLRASERRRRPPDDRSREAGLESRKASATRARAASPDGEPRPGVRAGRGGAILTRPFHAMEPSEAEAARELARELGRRLAARAARRERRLRHGRIDVRRTIRASLAHGGVPIDLEHRGRKPGKPDLLVLCDVSGSVASASELLLTILATAESAFRRVHRFAFVDRAVEIAFADGHVMPAGPLDLYARSDFGAVLCGLEAQHVTLFDRATVVLVVGDARNNRKPPRSDVLGRLATRSRALVWALPEPRSRWYTGDSALASYQPHCDFLCEATSLAGLLSSLREAMRR